MKGLPQYHVKVPKKEEVALKKFNPRYFNRNARKVREDLLRG